MDTCIFCTIVKGEIPNYTVYEDATGLAFLDIHPHAKGHTVVIPKVHAETTFDLNDELLKSFFPAVQKTMERIDTVLHPDGYTIGWNHGKAGGQAVPHLHVHIFPRWNADGGTSMHAVVQNPGDESVADVAKRFL
ncbi:MAG TPA: HIT family protein [Candidatus Kapabacteria bacterium]|nr:HIT family protein [Candidatus Kapabacteria bacterium]